jgi:predicted DNA-binding WGR domain protein
MGWPSLPGFCCFQHLDASPADSTLKAMSSVTLKRVNPAMNMRRFYNLTVERDLFGQTVLVRAWGRIGKAGRVVIEPHPTEEAADKELRRVVSVKIRKGYR